MMSRRNDESVIVGGVNGLEQSVKVTMLEIGHAIVRLGFEADADIPVHREEVWRRIRAGGRRGPPTNGRVGTELRDRVGDGKVFSGVGKRKRTEVRARSSLKEARTEMSRTSAR